MLTLSEHGVRSSNQSRLYSNARPLFDPTKKQQFCPRKNRIMTTAELEVSLM